MKKTYKLSAFLSSILMLSVITGQSAYSEVLWYGDPNKSVKENFRRLDPNGNSGSGACGDDNHPAPKVTTPNDSVHGKVWKINKPEGRKRAEFARTGFIPSEGQTLYYGWRWKITSSPKLNKGIAVWQWKTDQAGVLNNNKQNYPLNLGYDGTNLSMNAYGPGTPNWTQGASINTRRTTLWSKAVSPGEWVSIVIGMKLSKNKSNGYVELWFNGEKQTLKNSNYQQYLVDLSSDSKRAYHRTFDGHVTYPKWGSYNSNACGFNVSTYYDEMKIATTVNEAMPSGSTPVEEGYPGRVNLPGRIEAENYASAPVETSSGNLNNSSITQCTYYGLNVDVQNSSEGTCNVGWTASGEQLTYNIGSAGGDYDIRARIASTTNGERLRIDVNGQYAGTVSTNGAGWQAWASETIHNVNIPNNATLTVTFVDGRTNLNYLDIQPSSSSGSSSSSSSGSSSSSSSSSGGSGVNCTPVAWRERTEINLNQSNCIVFDRDLTGNTLAIWDSDENTACNFRGLASSIDGSGQINVDANYKSSENFSGQRVQFTPNNGCQFLKVRVY